MEIAHRGLWNYQNKIHGIVKACQLFGAVEVDVRVNSKGVLVLCHDKDKIDYNNDTLEDLCKVSEKLRVILEIKENVAQQVLETISGSHHEWELCSFDYRCVHDLCRLSGYKVGLVTAGAPHPDILKFIDFISIDYEFLDSEMLEIYRKHDLYVYVYNTDKYVHDVDGIIKNFFLEM